MTSEPLHPAALAGAETTAKIVKTWLVDEQKTRSGVIGVDNALQMVSVRTFQHLLTQPALHLGLGEAIQASATGVVAYSVADGERPSFDTVATAKLAAACDALNMTLLDVMIYSPKLPKGWISARRQGMI
jgi:hypothetical protein